MQVRFLLIVFCVMALHYSAAHAQIDEAAQRAFDSEYRAKQIQDGEQERKKVIHVGDYKITHEDREAFSKKIAKLIWVGLNDLRLITGDASSRERKYEKDDVDARKKFFSESAWQEYQAYPAQQRILLQQMGGGNMAVGGAFVDGPEQYTKAPGGKILFATDGLLYYQAQDAWCASDIPSRQFNLSVTLRPAKSISSFLSHESKELDEFVIDKWELNFCGAADLSCLYKNATQYDLAAFQRVPSAAVQGEGQGIVLDEDASDVFKSRLQHVLNLRKNATLLPSNGGALVHRDLYGRKKYFSEAAWRQYLSFVYDSAFRSVCAHSNSVITGLDVNRIGGNNFQLIAKVNALDRGRVVTCNKTTMEIQSTFEKLGSSRYDFIFTSWEALVCNEDGDKCEGYGKTSSPISEQGVNSGTQVFLFRHLLEWVKRTSIDKPLVGGGPISPLFERQKYFTESAWAQYQKYVEFINTNIANRTLYFKFLPERQSFLQKETDEFLFSVTGIYADVGPISRRDRFGLFEARVSFQQVGANADNILITDWAVSMGDPDKDAHEELKAKMFSR